MFLRGMRRGALVLTMWALSAVAAGVAAVAAVAAQGRSS